jgi:hypothetical protein
MRCFLAGLFTLTLSTCLTVAQTPPPPQTARQALVEMFFGTVPHHLQKHLPDATDKVLKRFNEPNGMNVLDQFSMISNMAKAGGVKLVTFDTGPTLLQTEDPRDGSKIEIAVEADNLSGEEDDIEVSLHMSKNGKEQLLPFIPRFTFAMKTEAEVWRLTEITVTVRVPLADPDFLKDIEDRARKQNEEMTIWLIRSVVAAEKKYEASNGGYACSLAAFKGGSPVAGKQVYLDPELAEGKKNGYVFAITACDKLHYKVVGEPSMTNSGERAFCSDESGAIRAASDGKAVTCLSAGEPIEEQKSPAATSLDISQ